MENLELKSEKLLLENESLNRKSERAKEGFSELEDKSIEIAQSEKQGKKVERSLRDLCDTIKHNNICMELQKGRRERKGKKCF